MMQAFVLTWLLLALMVSVSMLTLKLTAQEIIYAINDSRNKTNLDGSVASAVNLVHETSEDRKFSLK